VLIIQQKKRKKERKKKLIIPWRKKKKSGLKITKVTQEGKEKKKIFINLFEPKNFLINIIL